jgi:hypothetical protein
VVRPPLTSTPRDPLSLRVCEIGCALFAFWTICAHGAVAAGAALPALVALFAIGLALGGFGLRGIRRRGVLGRAPFPESAALGLTEPPAHGAGLEAALWTAAALCALYALFGHRVDASDSFSVNLAVAAVDRRDLPMLAVDTLHGRGDLPIFLPEFRLHALELGYAALAWLTGVQPIAIFHFVGAALGAAALPLAHAALLRWLAPRHWIAVLFVLLVLFAAIGDAPRGYGNTALLSSWQGEAIACFVFVPLVYAFAIRFALAPTGRHWALLAAAQIGALGCSAAALWAAPLAALLAMLCALPRSGEGVRRLMLGALPSAYLFAAALVLVSGAGAQSGERGAPLAAAIAEVLGDGAFAWIALAAAAGAWAACPRGLARRFAIAVPLGAALFALDPLADAWLRVHLAGPSYARVLGSLPAPLLLALALCAPLAWAVRPTAQAGRDRRAAALAASAALVLVVAIAAPARYGWSGENHVVWHWPGLKVPAEAVRWARLVNERAPRQRVLASRAVSTWIPVFHDHAYPLMVRDYLAPDREHLGEVAYSDRLAMTRYATGEDAGGGAPAIFARGLDLYGVQLVCLRLSEELAEQRAALRASGFHRSVRGAHYEIWERADRADGGAAGRAAEP